MPVPIIVAAAIVAALVLMIVLYRRARRSPLFADSVSFPLILIVRPAVILQKLLEKVAAYCGEVVKKSLHYPPHVESDVTHIIHVLARIILLAVSSIILCGDLYNLLLSIPILYGGVGGVSLPGGFAIPSALLYACMSALYGEIAFLECTNILP